MFVVEILEGVLQFRNSVVLCVENYRCLKQEHFQLLGTLIENFNFLNMQSEVRMLRSIKITV